MAWAPSVARQQRGEGIADVYITNGVSSLQTIQRV